MTPIIIILFLLGLITAYVFIALNQSKYTFSGDYKFVMFKFAILISTIALGFLTTAFSPYIESFPMIGSKIAGLYRIVDYNVIKKIILYISCLWFIFAIALLPFGHTIISTETGIVDNDRTKQLTIFYSAIYTTPYYILFTLFSLNLFFFIVSLSDWNHAKSYEGELGEKNETFNDYFQKVKQKMENIKPTLGFYFHRDNGEGSSDTNSYE